MTRGRLRVKHADAEPTTPHSDPGHSSGVASLCVWRVGGLRVHVQVGAQLVVLNLSQQTDSGDLLGGFRPVQPAEAVLPLLDTFADLVS